jgi:hypothetical protein
MTSGKKSPSRPPINIFFPFFIPHTNHATITHTNHATITPPGSSSTPPSRHREAAHATISPLLDAFVQV